MVHGPHHTVAENYWPLASARLMWCDYWKMLQPHIAFDTSYVTMTSPSHRDLSLNQFDLFPTWIDDMNTHHRCDVAIVNLTRLDRDVSDEQSLLSNRLPKKFSFIFMTLLFRFCLCPSLNYTTECDAIFTFILRMNDAKQGRGSLFLFYAYLTN